LLNVISGLLRPRSGGIFLNEKNISKMNISRRSAEIGYVMQDCDTQLFMQTVHDEIAYGLKCSGKPKSEINEIVDSTLNVMDLYDKKDAYPLALNRSGRIKTVFASIAALGPKILLLDEPFAGQDMRGCKIILDNLMFLRQKGYTVILVTHNMNIAAVYSDRIIIMHDAGLYLNGTPHTVLADADTLAVAGIKPPQITLLGNTLKKHLHFENLPLSPGELAVMLFTKRCKQAL
ncbi:MAG: energy-coupling factor ABC transporter ATP-binding protein, partial [Treponema sp.]|nr:energy-coupling factor ABC transporter ATP-binding protein [Treponema sp.]